MKYYNPLLQDEYGHITLRVNHLPPQRPGGRKDHHTHTRESRSEDAVFHITFTGQRSFSKTRDRSNKCQSASSIPGTSRVSRSPGTYSTSTVTKLLFGIRLRAWRGCNRISFSTSFSHALNPCLNTVVVPNLHRPRQPDSCLTVVVLAIPGRAAD